MPYRAPVRDLRFILDHVVGFSDLAATARFADATPDMVDAILTEAGRVATDLLAPLNRSGDLTPARLENGAAVTGLDAVLFSRQMTFLPSLSLSSPGFLPDLPPASSGHLRDFSPRGILVLILQTAAVTTRTTPQRQADTAQSGPSCCSTNQNEAHAPAYRTKSHQR